MDVICEALSDYPESTSSSLDRDKFIGFFRAVANKLQIPPDRQKEAESFLLDVAERQSNSLAPHNLRAAECPSLI